MKKKLIIGVLALSMCFAMSSCDVINGFLGNNSSTSSTTESEYDVAAAAEVLYDTLVDSDEETRVDYTVPNTLSYLKNVYTITWSVNVTEDDVKLTKGDTETTVVVNKNAQADIEYKLTAVVSDPNGKTETIEFERKVLQAPTYTPEAITAKPVENQAYKLYVYQSTSKIDCYFKGLMSGYYFATSEDYTEGVDVYVEYVTDSTDLFNLYFNHVTDGKQYIGVEISGTHSNIVYKSAPVSSFSYSTELGTIITNVEGTDYYLGNYSSYNTIQASKTSYASTSNVGGLVEMIDKNNIAPEKKVAKVKESLSVQAEHKMKKEIELPTYDDRFADVTIAWALSETTCATLSEGKLTLTTIPAEETSVTLTATITCGEKSDTKAFTLKLGPAIVLGSTPTEAEIVNAAFSLATNEALSGEFTLTGKITKIKSEYSEEYNNITVIISTNEKEIECFRLKGDGIATLKVGDTIEVKGTIKNYNGTVEFDSGCALLSVSEDQGGNEGTDTPADGTVAISIADIASANGWENSKVAEKIEYQGVTVTHSATPVGDYGQNSGKYYTSGTQWRFYQNENPTITISAPTGKQIATVKITYASQNTGSLTKDGANVKSDELVVVNGTSVSFGVGNTGTETKGQARITAITVVFGEYTSETPNPDEGGTETPTTPTYSLITAAPSSNTVYNLYVYQTTKEQHCFFTGEMNDYYFATTTEQANAVKVYVEYLADGTSFNLFFMKEGVRQYIGVKANGTYNNIVFDASPVSQFVWDKDYKTITTTISSGTFYLGNYNTFTTFSASTIDKAASSNVGGLYATSETVDKLPESVTPPDSGDETPAETLELSFADTTHRLSQDTNSQVWEQNGVKLTNNKAASTSNVVDSKNPVKLYAYSSVTIECESMKKIVFNCNNTSYATALKNSISDSNATVTVNGKVVTVEFTNAVDSFEIAKLAAQVRLDSLTVTKA